MLPPYIASGNIIFESADTDTPRLQAQIEQQLQQELGYEVATFLHSRAEVATIASYKPFSSTTINADSHTVSIM